MANTSGLLPENISQLARSVTVTRNHIPEVLQLTTVLYPKDPVHANTAASEITFRVEREDGPANGLKVDECNRDVTTVRVNKGACLLVPTVRN